VGRLRRDEGEETWQNTVRARSSQDTSRDVWRKERRKHENDHMCRTYGQCLSTVPPRFDWRTHVRGQGQVRGQQ